MSLKLMYITNRPDVAVIAEKAGVDRIFVDMEYIGKGIRQGGMDTVQSHHTVEDVQSLREHIKSAELLVRCNPIHNATNEYCSSEDEINDVIKSGADIIMLPFFKSQKEVERFVKAVGGRAKTMLLIETPEAAENIDEILSVDGIDAVHIGLNDLSLGYGIPFMFRLLVDGTVERLCAAINKKGIPYGFGGIAALGTGALPADYIIKEHYRMGSECAILSRSFCNCDNYDNLEDIKKIFDEGVSAIREYEAGLPELTEEELLENRQIIKEIVDKISGV